MVNVSTLLVPVTENSAGDITILEKVSANVKIYYRQQKYDKLIYEFYEKRDASYSLILNNIRSTMASKKNAERTSTRLLSEEIYRRILIFLSKN